tara:strand:+ start:834 stop:2534 length:1701 start_codon:yes stop_codon:yes gene_type:complete
MLKVLSSGLRRMTDSELEITATKLQEYFTLKLTTADFQRFYSSFTGYFSIAPYGSIIMTSLDRGVEESVQSFQVHDTKYNATVTSKSNDAFDNNADDDDSFSDPADLTLQNHQTFYLAQRHYANYTTSTPGFSGQTLQSGGDYYNNIRNWNGTTSITENNWSPAEMIRDYGHLTATSGGTVKIEKDVQKIYEAIFKYVNARIRSTSGQHQFGQYRIATSWPGTGWFAVREQMGVNGAVYYNAFQDTVTTVDSVNFYNNLTALSTQNTWYLWIKNIQTTGSNYDTININDSPNFTDASSSVRPTRLSRWKITVHSGSALEGTNSGDVREYYATGDYNGIGKYFYFKPNNVNGSSIVVSSNYSDSSPSDSSFGSQIPINVILHDEISDEFSSVTRSATLAPSGNSGDGQIYIYANEKYTATSSYNTNTVYKCERMNRLIEMDFPVFSDYDNRYDYTTFYGNSNYSSTIGNRRDHYRKTYVQNILYRLYTLGRYYPIYSLATSVGSSQFNHGSFTNTRRSPGNLDFGEVYEGLIGSNSDTTGTYYKVRGAGGTNAYETDTYYLVSDVES